MENNQTNMPIRVVWSPAFVPELMAHTVEFLVIPRQNHDTKKMPLEDQEDWLKACDDAMKSLAGQKFWKLVDLPPDRKPVKSRWVLIAKSNGRKKARLVAKGFTQIYGINFEETF